MDGHNLFLFYVMNDGCIKEQNVVFEKLDMGKKSHLKPLFIKVKVNNVALKLMPHSFIKMIGKFDTKIRPHNMVHSNY